MLSQILNKKILSNYSVNRRKILQATGYGTSTQPIHVVALIADCFPVTMNFRIKGTDLSVSRNAR